jgi:peroxiredoxin
MARRTALRRIAAALALCAVCAAPAAALDLPKPLAPGQVVPDFEALDLDGVPYKLSTALAEGGRVLLVYWSFYCAPCQEELPILQEEQEIFREKGIRLLTVTLDREETFEKIRKLIKVRRFTFPILQAFGEKEVKYNLEELLNVRLTPALYLIDKNRTITFSNYGPISPEDLLAAIDKNP